MHYGVEQQPQSVNQDMPLLALDQFAAVKSMWINARAAFFSTFHALAVNDAGGRAGFSLGFSRHLR